MCFRTESVPGQGNSMCGVPELRGHGVFKEPKELV